MPWIKISKQGNFANKRLNIMAFLNNPPWWYFRFLHVSRQIRKLLIQPLIWFSQAAKPVAKRGEGCAPSSMESDIWLFLLIRPSSRLASENRAPTGDCHSGGFLWPSLFCMVELIYCFMVEYVHYCSIRNCCYLFFFFPWVYWNDFECQSFNGSWWIRVELK